MSKSLAPDKCVDLHPVVLFALTSDRDLTKSKVKRELNLNEDFLIVGNRILFFLEGQFRGEGCTLIQLSASLNYPL